MTRDSGVPMTSLAVDGGMTGNNLLMQTLSDCLGVPVVRPMMAETVALGAAYGAGLVVATGPTAHSSGRTGTAPPSGPLKSKNTKDEPSSISGSMQCSWPSIGARDLGRRRTATRAPCATSGSPYGPWHRPTSMTNGEGSKRARVVIVAAPSARAHLHDYAWTSAPATSSIAALSSPQLDDGDARGTSIPIRGRFPCRAGVAFQCRPLGSHWGAPHACAPAVHSDRSLGAREPAVR